MDFEETEVMTNRQTNTLEASMLRLTVLTCLLLLAIAGPAWSVPQIMTEYGDQMPWLGADINAMGGTGAALYRGGMSNIFNPAFLATAKSHRLDLGVSLDQEHEDRFQPLYDTFDNVVTDVSIASNRHHYWQSGFGLVIHEPIGDFPLSLGLSLADRYPYSYTFEEELRDPSFASDPRDAIIEERIRKVTGTLRAASLGVGLGVTDWLSAGATFNYAFGTRSEIKSRRMYTGDVDGTNEQYDFDMTGYNFVLGLRGRVSERLELGVAYENALTVDGTADLAYHEARNDGAPDTDNSASIGDAYYRYPSIYRAGFTFYPQTDPRTVFTAELEYIGWNEFEDSLNPTLYEGDKLEKVVDVRIGLEHTFYNGVPLRFGFRHLNSYVDKNADSTIFTGGTGVPFGSGMFSGSVEIIKITSFQEHQFPYPDGFLTEPIARVEDTRFRVSVGYTVNW